MDTNLPSNEALANLLELCLMDEFHDDVMPLVEAYAHWLIGDDAFFEAQVVGSARRYALEQAQKYLRGEE